MPPREAWGLDIGQTALHAVKVRRLKGGDAEIVDIFFHPYGADLDDPDLDSKVEEALEEFVSEKNVGKTPVVASMPAFTTIFREFQLPSVSDSRLPEIVSYEAKQIIPFPLEDTVWDFQKVRLDDEDTGEVGIALICCRRDIIQEKLDILDDVGLNVEALQVTPLGLVNYVQFESPAEEVTLLLDAGARGTDFIILNEDSFWFRPIGVSGTDLTKALMQKFSIPFEEAENLKCKMGDSKQSDRVFRVVEPVLRSLAGDVQRSIGYYKSQYRGVRVEQVICAGNTFRLPGMDQFLADNVGIPTRLLGAPETMEIGDEVDEDELEEVGQTLGPAAGLALQGVGLAQVNMSLLPPERRLAKDLRRKMVWAVGAVALVLLTVIVNYLNSGSKATAFESLTKDIGSVKALASKAEGEFKAANERLAPAMKDNEALADVAPTRGYLLESSGLFFNVVDRLNARAQGAKVLAARAREEVRLFDEYARKYELTEEQEDEREHLRKQIERRMRWKYDRLGKFFVNDASFVVKRALFEKKPKPGADPAAKDGVETVFLRLLDKKPAGVYGAGELTPEETALETEIRHVVAVAFDGFVVSRTIQDANLLRDRIQALPRVIWEPAKDFEIDPGTSRRPNTNSIGLPEIIKPEPKETDETAAGATGAAGAAAVAETAPSASTEAKKVLFEKETEDIIGVKGRFVYVPDVWPPRETPKTGASGETP